jgi:DNA-binding MarR family transcriptional regulator
MTAARRFDSGHGRRASDLGIVDGLVQTSFAVQAVLGEIAAEHDLSIVQVRLLGILRDREPRMAQLAQLLGLTKSSATGLVDRAERRGLVQRASRPVGDERAVHVALTGDGRALVQGLGGEVARRLGVVVEGLSETGRQRLSRLLTQVVTHYAELHGVDLAAGRASTIAGESA